MTIRAFALLLFCLAPPAVADEVRLAFRAPVYRGPAQVEARELLHVWSGNSEATTRIGDAVLQLSDDVTSVSNIMVMESLHKSFPEQQWTWIGANSIRREPPFAVVTGEELAEIAMQALQARLVERGLQPQLSPASRSEPVKLRPGDIQLRARVDEIVFIRPRIAVQVEVLRAGDVERTIPVWLTVQAFRETPVFARALARGAIPEADDLQIARVDIARIHGDLESKQAPAGRLRHAVRAGDPLLQGMLEPIPDIQRGERVKVHVTSSTMSVTAWGIAQAEGFTGDTIGIHIDNADAPALARVIGKGELEIEL